ncbi:MAG: Indolepyruvate oxidoreductase subunit IorA [Methanosaeta sp. PtaU1.Bin055]|nr:MAG: Indolepyruvate oxidoreductase subunit IorA [Methanosaeta sp. PtaU1.Bin055]
MNGEREIDGGDGFGIRGLAAVDVLKGCLEELNVPVRIYVPGYPITDAVPALGEGAWMAINEKVALEVALGSSASGRRSIVLVKHLGVNLLSDPLAIAPSHTIGAGLVVLAGEDVGPRGSQAEMDVRNYGPLCEVPVLEPASPFLLGSALREAYALSEAIRSPAIVRTTFEFGYEARSSPPTGADDFAFSEDRGNDGGSAAMGGAENLPAPMSIDRQEDLPGSSGISAFRPGRGLAAFDRSIWEMTAKGRHQRHRTEALPAMMAASSGSSLNFLREGEGELGIIASGRPARIALDLKMGLSTLVVGFSHPLPWETIRGFVRGHDRILVVEEPAPFIEGRLQICEEIFGKLTGHLPWGRMEAKDLVRAIEVMASGEGPGSAPKPERFDDRLASKNVCDDCPFRPVYEAVRDLSVPVAGDAGCSIRAIRDPPAVDVVYGLGSSVAVASGFGEKGVALIGDYALAHSGLLGLIDSIVHDRDVLVVLLNNGVAAMTGGQSVPDISPMLEAIGHPRTIDLPADGALIERVLSEEMKRPGVSLLVARGVCPRFGRPRFAEGRTRHLPGP